MVTLRFMYPSPRGWACAAIIAGWSLLGVACSTDSSDAGSPCVDSAMTCGIACNGAHPCAAGLYCSGESLCSKQCTPTQGCSSAQHCGDNGRCLPGSAMSNQGGASGAAGATAGSWGSGIAGAAGMSYDPTLDSGIEPGPGEDCQTADVIATRVTPIVMLVIDQSGSMTQGFGSGGSRWEVLRDFLLKSDGLIASFETQVKFGLAMYSAVLNPDSSGTQECPIVTSVTPMSMNYAAIRDIYSTAKPVGETPTGDAIDKIVATLPKPELDKVGDPAVIILATDGEPDRCEELNPQNGQQEAIDAVKRAHAVGIDTFIISVGNEVSKTHQQDVANAGLGRDASNPAQYWTAGDDQTLRDALTEIIGAQVSCDVKLDGKVQGGNACDGTVELNGKKLTCNGADGWTLAEQDTIRLTGQACTDFKKLKSASIKARFPCTVPVLF